MTVGRCRALCLEGVNERRGVRESQSEQARRRVRRRTVVSSDKGVTVLVGLLTVDVFLCLFERNVHVAVEATEDACGVGVRIDRTAHCQRSWAIDKRGDQGLRASVVYAAVEPDDDGLTDDALEERAGTGQLLLFGGGCGCVVVLVGR